MDFFIPIMLILAAIGVVQLAELIAEHFLPELAKDKPMVLWLTGQGAEYKLRRAVRQARRHHIHHITVVCLDTESCQISRLIELANPDLEFDYGEHILEKCS